MIHNPRLSPDGARLRFDQGNGGGSAELWEAAADGTDLHPLLPGWDKPSRECCGRWTADGRYYLFESSHDGRTDIWSMPGRTSLLHKAQPVRLTSGPLNMMSPFPSPDGKKVYVVGEQQVGELVRYDSETRQFVPYLNGISAEGVSFSRDGRWGHLRFLSRRRALAQSRGWKRATATDAAAFIG